MYALTALTVVASIVLFYVLISLIKASQAKAFEENLQKFMNNEQIVDNGNEVQAIGQLLE